MKNKSEMLQGWEFATRITGAELGASAGDEYVLKVSDSIEQLERSINEHLYKGLDVPRFQGYVSEEYSAGTFNVNAAAADSTDLASVGHSTAKGSVDVRLDSGSTYSMKSYTDGAKSAIAQATYDQETGEALYHGQRRWVPADQLDMAKEAAHTQSLRNQPIRPGVAAAYAETESELTDVVSNDEGIESDPATREQLERIAKAGKRGEFSAADEGITLDSKISAEYMLQQAFKAGGTAAAITIAMRLAPEIYKAIDYLIKHGEIDAVQVTKMGSKALTAGAEGFLRGAVSCDLLIMCQRGMLGEAMRTINPTLLGAAVAIIMGTVKNSILVAAGKMSVSAMGAAFVDSVIVSTGFIAGMRIGQEIGGWIGQAIGFELPVVGYLVGSLVGCAFSVIFNIGKKHFISFCIDSGFTCFGLVEQNYELPESVYKELGVSIVPVHRSDVSRSDITTIGTNEPVAKTQYETIDITILRRGVIGVNKVGYIFPEQER